MTTNTDRVAIARWHDMRDCMPKEFKALMQARDAIIAKAKAMYGADAPCSFTRYSVGEPGKSATTDTSALASKLAKLTPKQLAALAAAIK